MGRATPRANIVHVNRSAANSPLSPRRFILLPEETALGAPTTRPRVRRYTLSGVGPGTPSPSPGLGYAGRGASTARVAGRPGAT